MSRLITFGCSHTYGEDLNNPEKECWPDQLSNLLKIPLINNGQGGASNRYIQHSVFNFKFQKKDTVIILWTYPDRYHFFKNKDNHTGLINVWSESKNSKFWFKNFRTDYNEKFDNKTIVNQVNLYLQKKGISVYNLVVSSEFSYYFDITDCVIIDLDFDSNFLKKYPKAKDGWHMGSEGHLNFSIAIHRRIINNNLKETI